MSHWSGVVAYRIPWLCSSVGPNERPERIAWILRQLSAEMCGQENAKDQETMQMKQEQIHLYTQQILIYPTMHLLVAIW